MSLWILFGIYLFIGFPFLIVVGTLIGHNVAGNIVAAIAFLVFFVLLYLAISKQVTENRTKNAAKENFFKPNPTTSSSSLNMTREQLLLKQNPTYAEASFLGAWREALTQVFARKSAQTAHTNDRVKTGEAEKPLSAILEEARLRYANIRGANEEKEVQWQAPVEQKRTKTNEELVSQIRSTPGREIWMIADVFEQLFKQNPSNDELSAMVELATDAYRERAVEELLRRNLTKPELYMIIDRASDEYKARASEELFKQNPTNGDLCWIVWGAPDEYKAFAWRQILKQNPTDDELVWIIRYCSDYYKKKASDQLIRNS